MLFKKKSIEAPSNLNKLDEANDLFEAGRWWDEEGNPTASTRNYAQALAIYNEAYHSIAGLELSRNSEFHIDFAQLYHSFAYHLDSDRMYEQAMFHYSTAAELSEEAKDYEGVAYIRQMQTDLLKLQGDYEQAELYEKMADAFNQDTAEFPTVTDEDIKEHDALKRKPRSPRQIANTIVAKVVNIVLISKS